MDRRPVELRVIAQAMRAGLGFGPFPDEWLAGLTPDWNRVLAGAQDHRVVPLVATGLADSRLVPAAVAETLTGMARNDAARCLGLAAETLRVLALFQAEGIRCLAIKGVVLSQRLHGDPARRGARDIDIWIDPERFAGGEAILKGIGYWLADAPPGPEEEARELTYRSPAGILVELHRRLFPKKGRFDLDFAEAWDRRETVTVAGVPVPTLPADVLPVYLCAHGAYHCWERLFWLGDMAVLLGDERGAAAALASARPQGLAEAMILATSLTRLMFGVPEGTDLPDRARRAIRFANRFHSDPPGLPPAPRGTAAWFRKELRRRAYLYSLKTSPRYFLSELVADLTNPVDQTVFRLPAALAFLYPLLRPLGWVMRNFLGKGAKP